jgi:hypothetical protein
MTLGHDENKCGVQKPILVTWNGFVDEDRYVLSSGGHTGDMDPVLQFATLRSTLYYGAIYAIVLAVAVWIYRDAKARGSNRAVAWFLATLVFTILPVLAYLYLHRDAGPAPRR